MSYKQLRFLLILLAMVIIILTTIVVILIYRDIVVYVGEIKVLKHCCNKIK